MKESVRRGTITTHVPPIKLNNMRAARHGVVLQEPIWSSSMGQINMIGKELVAQQRRKRFFRLKLYIVSVIIGGFLGLTISGFWGSLVNRCSACGRLGAEIAHRRTLYPEEAIYYTCQPEQFFPFFLSPPEENRIEAPTDDR